MTRSTRHDRLALATTLAWQYQVISRRQAIAHGMTASALRQRLRADGPWQRLLPGVFMAVTGTPTAEQRNVAALLYAGSGSLITGSAAVRLRGVPTPPSSAIDVLIPASRQRRNAGFVRVHPTARMPEEIFTAGPVRLAPLARAIADTARGLTRLADVRALVAAVVQQGKCEPGQLVAELQAGPVQGSALFRAAISDVCEGTRSSPEAELRDLIRRGKIPEPLFNPSLYAGDEFIGRPDAWWKEAGVAAEVDSRAYHLSPQDHERTLERDARMAAHGITVLHFTPRQIRTQPGTVIATLRSALAAASCRPRLPLRTVTTTTSVIPEAWETRDNRRRPGGTR